MGSLSSLFDTLPKSPVTSSEHKVNAADDQLKAQIEAAALAVEHKDNEPKEGA